MKRHVFKYVKAQNFLCFGPAGIEINFENLGNIVLIRGRNLDVSSADEESEEAKGASNGAGKSSVPELIVYGLYGKTIKRPKKIGHGDVIHNKTGKKLYVEVRWDNYRAVRTRKPDGLRLWESADGVWNETTEITLGGMPATQTLIEDKVGMSYETFVNVCVFTDDNSNAFLECDTPAKRQIVENLLSLDKYRNYSDNAKSISKANKDKIKLLTRDYEMVLHDVDRLEKRAGDVETQDKVWRAKKLDEIRQLNALLQKIKTEMLASDAGSALLAYEKAQQGLAVAENSLATKSERFKKLHGIIDQGTEQYHIVLQDEGIAALAVKQAVSVRTKNQQEADELEAKKKKLADRTGTKCPSCYGTVREENFSHVIAQIDQQRGEFLGGVTQAETDLVAVKLQHTKKQQQVVTMRGKLTEAKGKLDLLEDEVNDLKNEVRAQSSVPKPDVDKKLALLHQKSETCEQQITQRKDELEGASPYEQILTDVRQDLTDKKTTCQEKRDEVKEGEREQPYLDYWIKAFGDTGIRRFVINGIVPALNARVSYWLQYLIDNKICLTFNDQLEEKIQRNPADGTEFLYHVLSNGQRRRLNLAVSQAFAHVMMLNTGTSPSLVFLDEVTTNIDPIGVQGIYNMICELAKDKQVFVTTHDQDLLSMLHGCDTLWLEMRDGATKVADNHRPKKHTAA